MFYVLHVGAELDKRYLTPSGDFGSWGQAKTFFSRAKAEKAGEQSGYNFVISPTR